MKTVSANTSNRSLTKKFGGPMTHRFLKGSIPKSMLKKGMFVENVLLRESRKFSQARNKYTTGMLENTSMAERFVNSKKSQEENRKKQQKYGILTPLAT
jgi:hypothetical protein